MNEKVKFVGTLRTTPPQAKACSLIYDDVIKKEPTSGSILSIYCGGGKTATAIHIALQHGRRTLVLVNNEELLHQWVDRLGTFAPEAQVGVIQQKTCDVEGKDFVIGMLQSIASHDYSSDVMDTFGLCIVDECHRIACRYFSTALMKISAAHILGLSATPTRKDGMTDLMLWTCGPVRFTVERPLEEVQVRIIQHKLNIKEKFLRGTGGLKHNRSRMITDMSNDEIRNRVILKEMINMYQEGRSILMLCDRLCMIEWFRSQLNTYPDDISYGVMTGGVKKKERQAALGERIILGTYTKAKEGLDVPHLDTLILATPVSDVIQAVGRILRSSPDKKTPLVVDVWDQQEPFMTQGYARMRYYKKQHYIVHHKSIDEKKK